MIPRGSTTSQTTAGLGSSAARPRHTLRVLEGACATIGRRFHWNTRLKLVSPHGGTRMRRTMVALGALLASLLGAMVGPVLADDLCFSGVTNQQFHLNVTGTVTTSVGTVMNLTGIDHMSGDPDLKSPVTGT